MTTSTTPLPTRERIYTLDVIRGFALLGIYIMNMPWFNTSFYAGTDGVEPWPAWYDQWTRAVTDVLFSGKFNSMFSMLFAIGFTIPLERLDARDPEHARAIYLRHIFWLFVFGLVHLCVFWNGGPAHLRAVRPGAAARVQVPLSRWWLQRFEIGPMEWVWRRLAYGQATMKRVPAARAPA